MDWFQIGKGIGQVCILSPCLFNLYAESVQFSYSVMSDSLQRHGLHHTRLPHPSPTPGACSNSCPSSQWCHPTILTSVIPFSSCLQSFPASGSFPVSQFFASVDQNIEASASSSVLPMNIQDCFPLGLTGLISLQDKELSNVIQHDSSKASILWHSASFMVQISHPYMNTGKTLALTRWAFVGKVMSLLFIFFFFPFIFISWRLITLQYCSGFCHTLT